MPGRGPGLGVAGRSWRGERLPNRRGRGGAVRQATGSGRRRASATARILSSAALGRSVACQPRYRISQPSAAAARSRSSSSCSASGAEVELPAVALDAEQQLGDGQIDAGHERPVVGPDLVLAHDGRELGTGQRQLEEALEPGVGHSLLPLGRVEQAEEHPGAPPARTLQTLGRHAEPAQALATTADVVEGALHHLGVVPIAEIDEGAGEPRATDAVDRRPSPRTGAWRAGAPRAPVALSVPRRGIVTSSGPSANPSRPWSAAAAAPLMTPVPVPASSSTFSCCRHVAGAPTMVSTPGRGSRILLVTFQRKIWSASTSSSGGLSSAEGTVLRGRERSDGAKGVVSSHRVSLPGGCATVPSGAFGSRWSSLAR